MRVIGFAGKAGSGKTTAAALLAGLLVERGYTVALDGFATALKQEARNWMGWDGDKSPFWREWMQRRGLHVRRTTGQEHWIRRLEKRWCHMDSRPDFLVVTDVRFANELAWVRAHGRLVCVVGRGGLDGEAGQHPSETELDAVLDGLGPSFRLDNSTMSMGDLRNHLAKFLDVFIGDARQEAADA